ncbi:MAG: hypothetical protein IPF68_13175 [Bacteroidales bacterium]|nr:hypothetical protein [Bacteroidales bacterium]
MKHFQLFLLLLLSGNLVSLAQTVTNLRFEQSAKMIDVYYDLSGKDNESIEVKIYCSQDGGNTWGSSLYHVTGAAGVNIKPGLGKKITWDVLREKDKLVGEIKFKVEANAMSVCRSFTITHSAGSVCNGYKISHMMLLKPTPAAKNAGLPKILVLKVRPLL